MISRNPYEAGRCSPSQVVRRLGLYAMFFPYLFIAIVAGLVWYLCLSLPISPMSHAFLVRQNYWPDIRIVASMSLASTLSAWAIKSVIATPSNWLVVLSGFAYTCATAITFALVLFLLSLVHAIFDPMAYPLYGGGFHFRILLEAIYALGYALLVTVLSGHVVFPIGVASAFLLRLYALPASE